MSDVHGPRRSSAGSASPPPPGTGDVALAAPAPAGGQSDLGTSMIPTGRSDPSSPRRGAPPHRDRGGHRRRARSPLADAAAGAVPALLLALVVTIDLVAFLVSPLHIGPLPAELVLVLVAATAPLSYTACRRLGLSIAGSVVAAAVAAFTLPTASSDVVGAPEHAAVVAGLAAVTFWPFNLRGTKRRYLAGVLGGIAVIASPFAIVAIAAAITWLVREPVDRARRLAALRGPVITGCSIGIVGLATLIVSSVPLDEWTWGGAFTLATVIISLSPALGFLAGIGADASVAAARSPEPMPRFAGVIGGLALALLIAAAAGAAAAQIRDRALVGELEQAPAAVATSGSGEITG